jgi:hypothetical protein
LLKVATEISFANAMKMSTILKVLPDEVDLVASSISLASNSSSGVFDIGHNFVLLFTTWLLIFSRLGVVYGLKVDGCFRNVFTFSNVDSYAQRRRFRSQTSLATPFNSVGLVSI